MDNLLEMNKGGATFLVRMSILKKYPETRLGLLNFQSEEYFVERGFCYVDRNPELFNIILDFYRNDTVHLSSCVCSALVQAELDFWRIPCLHIAECCRSKFLNSDNELETSRKIHSAFGTNNNPLKEQLHKVWSTKVWLLCNEPLSTRAAKAYSIVYLLVVLLSVVMTFLYTIHEIREKAFDLETLINESKSAFAEVAFNVNSSKEVLFTTTRMPKWWYHFILLATLFRNFIFLAEYKDPTAFPSMFSSLWWSVVTMTTVGYGGAVPKSITGKVVDACAACSIVYLLIVLLFVIMTFLYTIHEIWEKAFDLDTLIKQSKSAFAEVAFNVNSSKEVLFTTTRMPKW
ncbi:Hypothetical predicted protein [Mytilus galloprovincialis]|uniref:Uncharacterized protein n=1 Tax=Mytilus galloprovincialis TaxID=29158 RepID=A0A8B6HR59_MYTGA|nr:Hypothetical predicted protein [Mytilus galloprovincialis]